MKKYISFFYVRFTTGLQYRMYMVTALTTQVVWSIMECLAFKALMDSNAVALPMEYSALVSYVWLKEAFYALFNTWATDNDIFSMIIDGGIAYELCRPISVYKMWFSRNVGGRVAQAVLRCIPVLIVAMLMPSPFKISPPASPGSLFLFILTMLLGLGVTVSFCMLVYILCFFTISPQGWRILFTGAVEFLSGVILPLPFIPQPYRRIIECLPFASMQNVPLRIYSGDLCGKDMLSAIVLQILWFAALYVLGSLICKMAEKKVIVQGG
jgi:ABC-2 type transport system permease protein